MAILPAGSILSIGGNSFIVDSVQYTHVIEPFDRVEFDNSRLRSVPETDGSAPIIIQTLGGRPAQVITSCASGNARPLGPNSSANVDNIKKRFNIKRYTIQAAPSLNSSVNAIYTIAETHSKLLAKFNAHIAKAGLEISYSTLAAMQSETFSYLTSTGISLAGLSTGTESNMLISAFSIGVEFEIPDGGSGTTLYKSFSVTIENRTISAFSA